MDDFFNTEVEVDIVVDCGEVNIYHFTPTLR